MRLLTPTKIVSLGLLLAPVAAWQFNQPYLLETIARLIVFAIAAASLNFITGFGGMVSLGHAMYIGLGAYTVGIMTHHGFDNGFLQLAVMLVVTGLAALVVGAIALRASGIFFIMITLALAQIFYYTALSSRTYGGEEGLRLVNRSDFTKYVDLYDPYQFYLLCVAALFLCIFLQWRLIRAPFGKVLTSIRENERRALAIGYNTFVYKIAAMVISGMMCGLSGFLLANLSDFVSPDYAYWHRSGELLVMVLLGGMGTLVGPVLGALAFLGLETWVAGLTKHWGLVIGPILIIVVLTTQGGILGLVDKISALARGTRA